MAGVAKHAVTQLIRSIQGIAVENIIQDDRYVNALTKSEVEPPKSNPEGVEPPKSKLDFEASSLPGWTSPLNLGTSEKIILKWVEQEQLDKTKQHVSQPFSEVLAVTVCQPCVETMATNLAKSNSKLGALKVAAAQALKLFNIQWLSKSVETPQSQRRNLVGEQIDISTKLMRDTCKALHDFNPDDKSFLPEFKRQIGTDCQSFKTAILEEKEQKDLEKVRISDGKKKLTGRQSSISHEYQTDLDGISANIESSKADGTEAFAQQVQACIDMCKAHEDLVQATRKGNAAALKTKQQQDLLTMTQEQLKTDLTQISEEQYIHELKLIIAETESGVCGSLAELVDVVERNICAEVEHRFKILKEQYNQAGTLVSDLYNVTFNSLCALDKRYLKNDKVLKKDIDKASDLIQIQEDLGLDENPELDLLLKRREKLQLEKEAMKIAYLENLGRLKTLSAVLEEHKSVINQGHISNATYTVSSSDQKFTMQEILYTSEEKLEPSLFDSVADFRRDAGRKTCRPFFLECGQAQKACAGLKSQQALPLEAENACSTLCSAQALNENSCIESTAQYHWAPLDADQLSMEVSWNACQGWSWITTEKADEVDVEDEKRLMRLMKVVDKQEVKEVKVEKVDEVDEVEKVHEIGDDEMD